MIDERTFVLAQRAKRFSWQAIALQLRVCESDLRRRYDHTKTPETAALVAEPKPPRRRPAPSPLEPGTWPAKAFEALGAANGAWRHAGALAPAQSAAKCVERIRSVYGRDTVDYRPIGSYRLTVAGRDAFRQYAADNGLTPKASPLGKNALEGVTRDLQPREIEILHALAAANGALRTVAQLRPSSPKSAEVAISQLRHRFGRLIIEVIRGKGYRLTQAGYRVYRGLYPAEAA